MRLDVRVDAIDLIGLKDGVLGADILINYNCIVDYKGMNLYVGSI